MSTEKHATGAMSALRDPSYKLAMAQVAGRAEILIVLDGAAHLLSESLPSEVDLPDELFQLVEHWSRWRPLIGCAAGVASRRGREVEVEKWLLPVRPSKLICVGTNYHDHLREMGTPTPPTVPYAFFKPVATGLVASGGTVRLPTRSKMVDWEAELAVVIGHTPTAADASTLDCVAGYTVYNDLSARDWIIGHPEVGIDWVMMKAYDGFSPIGPLFTPAEFVTDPQNLTVQCWVNGELKQDSNTSQMVFDVATILEHLAGIMTLKPGDVIATGTPAGVGFGARPQQFLKHGDTVEVEVEGLGRLETHMVDHFEGELI